MRAISSLMDQKNTTRGKEKRPKETKGKEERQQQDALTKLNEPKKLLEKILEENESSSEYHSNKAKRNAQKGILFP